MRSKEQILADHGGFKEHVMKEKMYDLCYSPKEALAAMAQFAKGYAKEVAIAFADFKKNYRWLKSSNAWTSEKDDLLTTEQLFNLFIEQQNKL